MKAVDDYYAQLEMTQKVDIRRVFIASDDPKVKCLQFKYYKALILLCLHR